MMAALLPPDASETHLDDDIAALWREGFDTFDIAAALNAAGETINGRSVAEADICRALARRSSRRRASSSPSSTGR